MESIVGRSKPVLDVLISKNLDSWLTFISDLIGLLRDEKIDVSIWGNRRRDYCSISPIL